eukprot:Polyplicarium_translucidae@DN3266_c0_g1_i4.p2
MLLSPKDEMALVTYSVPQTDNDINTDEDGFENIVALREMGIPDVDFALSLDEITSGGDSDRADPLGALEVACDLLGRPAIKKRMKTHHSIIPQHHCSIPNHHCITPHHHCII